MIGNRWKFFVVEAMRSLRTNLATTLAAIVTVLIVMYLFGVGLALGSYVYSYSEQVKSDLTLRVFLANDITTKKANAIEVKMQADPRIQKGSVKYINKQTAYNIAKRKWPDLVANTLPGTFPAEFDAKALDASQLKAIAASIKGMPGLDQRPGTPNPKYGERTADRIITIVSAIELVLAGIGIVLAVAAVLLIGNTIRLSIFARRREVEVMKLVGATNWFVRWPFMIEGIFCGVVGAITAVLLLALSMSLLSSAFSSHLSQTTTTAHGMGLLSLGAILLLAGLGLGAAGSGITMRKFLRV